MLRAQVRFFYTGFMSDDKLTPEHSNTDPSQINIPPNITPGAQLAGAQPVTGSLPNNLVGVPGNFNPDYPIQNIPVGYPREIPNQNISVQGSAEYPVSGIFDAPRQEYPVSPSAQNLSAQSMPTPRNFAYNTPNQGGFGQPISEFSSGPYPNYAQGTIPPSLAAQKPGKPKKSAKKFWVIFAIVFSLILVIGALGYKFYVWDAALVNGVKEKWFNDTEIKFSNISDDFEPYTIALSEAGEDVKLAVIAPSGKDKASYREISSATGKVLGEKPQDLPACDFSKDKQYQAKAGKIICVDIPQENSAVADSAKPQDSAETKKAETKDSSTSQPDTSAKDSAGSSVSAGGKGDLVYQGKDFQIRVAPLNGAMAKQIFCCSLDGAKIFWVYDLPTSGYVTFANGNIYVTTVIPGAKNTKPQQVLVRALMPVARSAALPAKTEKDVAVLPRDAIKKLDLNNLVYPLNFGYENGDNCSLPELKAGGEIPKVPKKAELGSCFTQVIDGKAVEKVKDGMPPYDMVPVIDFHSVKSKELADKKGILEFHNGENTETFYLDVNNDGYLDAIREGFMPDGSGAMAYYLIIFNPSQPNRPFSTFLYGTQGAEVLKFLDGKLSLGYFNTPIEDPLGMIFWEMKIENRNGKPYIKEFKRYRRD